MGITNRGSPMDYKVWEKGHKLNWDKDYKVEQID